MDDSLRALQLKELDLLKYFQQVCEENEITYFALGGTLLGAVRHKGFIPWDDDMDICMPRPDYDLLVTHCKEWLPAPYELKCAETEKNYPGAFGKIIDSNTTLIERKFYGEASGLYIDIFPIDGVPQNKLMQRVVMAKYKFYERINYYLHRDPYKHGHGPSSWIPLLCQHLFNSQKVQKSVNKMRLKYLYDDSQLVADYDDGLSGIISKSVLGKPTPIQFEGVTLMGVNQYHAYLSNKYGDYMKVPEGKEQRQHNFYFLDYNLPYRQYKDENIR